MLQAFLPKIFRHLIKIMLAPAIRLSRFHIAVADKKMHMNVVGISMHRKQHFVAIAVNKMLRKIPRYLKRGLVIHIIQRVK